jgi:hypothetical protein
VDNIDIFDCILWYLNVFEGWNRESIEIWSLLEVFMYITDTIVG